MAFQVPVTVQNVVATTSELWPTMSAVLKYPWKGFARQTVGVVRHSHASKASEAHRVEPRSSLVLPKCLKSTSVSALRQTYSPQALESIPTVAGSVAAVPRNALRLFSPLTRSLPLNTFIARQFSTTSRYRPFSNIRPVSRPCNLGLALVQSRSLFGGPSHSQLARYEQAANKNPSSAAAQYTFYQALLKANMPQIVVDRYQSGNYASNAMVEQVYGLALQKTGRADVAGQNMNGIHGLSPQQLQAVGQAVGAHSGGSAIAKLRAGSGLKTDPLYVVVEEPLSKTVGSWIKWIVGFALLAYFALVVITLLVESTGVLKKVGGGGSAEVRPEHQNTRFSDVQGCDEAKEELTDIVDFLKNPDRYNKLGGRLPKGVLLIGPPGTGKTLLARAVAGEAGVPFFYMSGSEFDEVYVGVGAKRVRELFATARAKAPAIVFIDELDAVGGKRQSRDANYHRQTLNQLLNDLDGFDQTSGVIFIAATNHPEILDKALLRPGRFDRHVQVELPDVRGRLAILKHHTKKIRLSPDADLSKIARGTPGFSGAELENLANTAAIQASKHQAKNVSHLDLEWAKDKIMMGSERKTRVVPLADKLQTAYHEGGHTLVGLYRKGYNEVHKATILPRGQAAGITYFLPVEEHHRSRAQYIRHLEVCMGGKMAEEIVFGNENVGDGVSGDIQQATQLAYMMVTQFGFSDLLGNVDFRSNYDQVSPETKRLIDNEVRRLIDEAKESAKKLLLEHRSELDALAKGLVQYETLDREEIMKVIKGEKLPDRLEAMPNTPIKIPELPLPPHVPPPLSSSGDGGVGAMKEDK